MTTIPSNSIGLVINSSNPLATGLGGTGNTSGTTTPSGSAGGALTGSYPNPTLAAVNSNIGSFGSATQVGSFTVNAAGQITAASNVTVSGVVPGGSAGGDLSGSYPNPTVAKLSNATASQAVVVDASKNIASLAYTSANTINTLVERDSSGNFSAGTITASLTGTATVAITSQNSNNVLTTSVSSNASWFPLMVASSSNINQAASLSTGWSFNPSTNTLNTSILQASASLQVGTTTNSAPITVQGNGGTTGATSLLAAFMSSASPAAGNLFAIEINKSGAEVLIMGVNKNTTTGQIPANATFISTYTASGLISIGRGGGSGLPNENDLGIDGSGNVTINNGTLDITTIGNGLKVAEGSNAKQNIVTLVAGTLVVSNTSVTANSRIFLTCQVPGGTVGFLRVSARVAGTSFTILSSNALDTSQVAYEMFEPG